MITLEQFEQAIIESRPLYYINTELEVKEFTPERYEVSRRINRSEVEDWIVTYTVGSDDNWYYHAERCFETKAEAEAELKNMLLRKLASLK